ncbi:MAG: tRNA lysidine(34) synthetase TilS [Acidimicrobiia bacterium]
MARPNGQLTDEIVDDVAEVVGGQPCAVALGGGADSAVLLAAAASASDPSRVRSLFVNHGLEGSSMLEAAAVSVSEMFGIKLEVLHAEIGEGPDLEARARHARYKAMESALAPTEIGLTAHTRDDQAETVLMNLMRGSGGTGLAGIPRARGRWRRPFLDRRKVDLRQIADALDIPYADDPANEDLRFTRVRFRSVILPFLEAELDRPLTDAITRSADLIAADDAFLDSLAAKIVLDGATNRVLVPTAPIADLPVVVKRRIARRALRMVMNGYPGTSEDVERILVCLENGVTQQITQGLLVANLGPYLIVGEGPTEIKRVDVAVGESFAWDGSRFKTAVVDDAPPIVDGGRFTLLDAAAVGPAFSVRGWEPGDRLDINSGSTPVSELLRANGVPALLRPVSPLICDDARIAAVVGIRTAVWATPRRGGRHIVIERELQ